MDASGQATAEFSAGLELGAVSISAEHGEHLIDLTRAGEPAPSDPLARRSRISASGDFELGRGSVLPIALNSAHGHFSSGTQELDATLESGLHVPGVRFAARLNLNQEFGTADSAANLDGRFGFSLDWLGGRHQGRLDYDFVPTSQATEVAFESQWPLGADAQAGLDLSYRPREARSELEVGLNQDYGPFSLGSDISADSAGAFAIGFSLSFSLAPASTPSEWRLSNLLSSRNSTAKQNLVPVPDTLNLPAPGEHD